ncbi:MAG: beta-phosphoglucomutase [Trueperaceae bacterium]
MSRHRDPSDVPPRFPTDDPWRLTQRGVHAGDVARDETLFSVGNGYLGVRGTPEEGTPEGSGSVPGHYLAGFHEREALAYPEDAYGLARWRQTMLNVVATTRLELTIDGAWVRSDDPRASEVTRALDLRAGTLTREWTWTGEDGARTRVRTTRAASLPQPHRALQAIRIEPLDRPVAVQVRHPIDGRVENRVETGDPRVGTALKGQVLRPTGHGTGAGAGDGPRRWLRMRAPNSGMELIAAVDPEIWLEDAATGDAVQDGPGDPPTVSTSEGAMYLDLTAQATVPPGRALRFAARSVLSDDRYASDLETAAAEELRAYARDGGADGLLRAQRAWLDAWWEGADVTLEGDPALQQAIRVAAFHLLQGTGRDGRSNVPSKGLSGEGYEGHVFWDTEIYVLPFFLHVAPDVARALVRYRIGMLPAARERARELRHPGALYPWRTIAGPEASAYFPAGTAQVHIDADVVHALERTVRATGDEELLWGGGAAVAIECARFYRSIGHGGRDGAFHLATVTGPDEYTALVDDNHYTNRMMQATLRYAAATVRRLEEADPDRWATEARALDLHDDEVAAWTAAADAVHLPVDEATGVTPQDATFLTKPEWPWGSDRDRLRPLLLHHHPLDIYRHQVLKQADVLLAHLLLPGGVGRTRLRRDEAYYAPRTTHDSSLSPCVHAIYAVRLGRPEAALDPLRRTARIDLDDLNGNVADGVHAAAAGGTWLALVQGFGGFEVLCDRPCFYPRLPAAWTRLRFRVAWRGRTVEVDAGRDVTRYRLLSGPPLTIRHQREPLELRVGDAAERPTPPRLRGVAFDLDGVLTDSAEQHYLAWKALADRLGIAFDREANHALRGRPRDASLDAILARAPAGTPRPDAERRRALANEKNEHYRRLIEQATPADLLPGIPELLAQLRGAGVRLALASSSRNGPTLLRRLGIEDRFDAVIIPATLRFGKPDPEIFEAAAEALDLPTDACAGIEDAPAGVRAVRGAGMASVAVGPATRHEAATAWVADTRELTLKTLQRAVREHAAGDADASDTSLVDTPPGGR